MRKPLSLILGLAAGVASVGVVASPAQAATGWDRCPTSRFCIFEHADGQGKYAYFSDGWADMNQPIGGFVFNDKVSSVWNRVKGYPFCYYEHPNYGGGVQMVPQLSGKQNLSAYWSDRISSVRTTFGSEC